MAVPISNVSRSSLQKTDSMEAKRFEIKKVTGRTAITSISCDVAGTNIKLSIEKIKMINKTK
jgi:hypothetical protein